MYCNKIIHDEWEDIVCPFCYKQIKKRSVIPVKCWDEQQLENKDHKMVYINYGQIDGYDPMHEFCSFNDNKCNIVRKSVYYRIHYLDKVIFNLH